MEVKNSLLLIGIISLLFGAIKYNSDLYYGKNELLNEINIKNRNFIQVNSELPFGHIVKLNDKFLICSGMNSPQFYIKHEYLSNALNNGGIYSYNIQKNKLQKIELDNYPSSLQFHPKGLSLYQIDSDNYYLYAINHLIKSEPEKYAEKIEKFHLRINNDKITLYYKNSYSLPKHYFGTLNSIAAVSEKLIYFTNENAFSLPCYSENDKSISKYMNIIKYKIYSFLNILFKNIFIKKTFLYSYNCDTEEIKTIYNSNGISNRGLVYDHKNSLLYMARSFEKDIKIFEISRNSPSNALLIKTIKTLYNVENIYYDDEYKKIYLGIYGSIQSLTDMDDSYNKNGNYDSVSTFGGFEEIDVENNYDISNIILFKDEMKGISSAIKIKDEIFFSSKYQNGILIYKKN